MIAKKLLVSGIIGTVMMLTATSNTATAAPPHVRVVARPVVYGGNWHRPYYYTAPVYVSTAPVVAPVVAPAYDCWPYWNTGVYVGAPRVGIRIGR